MAARKMENCIYGGCREGMANKTFCLHCGWDKQEDARRAKIPYVQCKDGLWRKIIKKPGIEKADE